MSTLSPKTLKRNYPSEKKGSGESWILFFYRVLFSKIFRREKRANGIALRPRKICGASGPPRDLHFNIAFCGGASLRGSINLNLRWHVAFCGVRVPDPMPGPDAPFQSAASQEAFVSSFVCFFAGPAGLPFGIPVFRSLRTEAWVAGGDCGVLFCFPPYLSLPLRFPSPWRAILAHPAKRRGKPKVHLCGSLRAI